jgi:CIC family chloride channel protein
MAPALTRPSASPKPSDFSTDRRVLLLFVMALFVGGASALSAWVLVKLIALTTNLLWFGTIDATNISLSKVTPSWLTVAIPVAGSLVIGLMARFGSEKIRGHGIPEAIEAILIGQSRVQPKVALLKPISSAVSIGSGGPFGAEGPIIMTGGAIGSLFAQFFHLSAAERKTLLVAGASAGMTAIFGTPIAAVLLALELLLFEWKPRSLIPVITASVVAVVARPFLLGSGPLFPLAGSLHLSWWGFVLAAGVGISVGLLSCLLTVLLYAAEDLFARLPIHWMWWPLIGGLAIGIGGLFEPRALGVGYDVIGDLLHNNILPQHAIAIVAVKAAIWIIALASGTSGGVLAPLLIMGGALGSVEALELPGPPGCWALMGMAAMLAGTMRCPLTGVLFAVEITGNFDMIVPLLVAGSAAYGLNVLVMKRSILTEKIARHGHHITREYTVDPFALMRVSDVMVEDVKTLPASLTVEEAIEVFSQDAARHKSYPLIDEAGVLVGMVARADILRWKTQPQETGVTLYDRISDSSPIVGYDDEPVGDLADRMVESDVGRVPIVDRATFKVVGLVARKDLLRIRQKLNESEKERAVYLGGFKTARAGA